ncbi:MAG: VOC family protein [Actinomycetota bacterium]
MTSEERSTMQLEGIHHITCITADAPGNVAFYVGTLGLRMVKKTVNQDDPTVYHLFYADEQGSAGSAITFFEYPGVPPGRAGAGMVHTIVWRVASKEALDFWEIRLGDAGIAAERHNGSLRFTNPEGLAHELKVDQTGDPPLRGAHPDIPDEVALGGFDAVRAYSADVSASESLLTDVMGFDRLSDHEWDARGAERGGRYVYDPAPNRRGLGGAGAVHHVAWASGMDDHDAWRERVAGAGMSVTPVVDRFWFRSIYFREPSGVLFEIATLGPGFTADEPLETLGQALTLPPAFESLREQLERQLTPLPNPEDLRRSGARS